MSAAADTWPAREQIPFQQAGLGDLFEQAHFDLCGDPHDPEVCPLRTTRTTLGMLTDAYLLGRRDHTQGLG